MLCNERTGGNKFESTCADNITHFNQSVIIIAVAIDCDGYRFLAMAVYCQKSFCRQSRNPAGIYRCDKHHYIIGVLDVNSADVVDCEVVGHSTLEA